MKISVQHGLHLKRLSYIAYAKVIGERLVLARFIFKVADWVHEVMATVGFTRWAMGAYAGFHRFTFYLVVHSFSFLIDH
jgi:hypothetical protein